MVEQTEKCGHEQCHCTAQADTGFCSEHCQQANLRREAKTGCGCGHAGCTTGAKIQPAGSKH